ncbi:MULTISPECIES: DUF3307 domain-containing protein [Dictyoglomus]|uniref:DUF3307 domain-containing protein n=1 Tax=Dictyoglomus TaxID=13 RepID=UPI002357E95C|nr:DUF3307 domain-containing protein [Dictyoglomus turgidum]
MFWFLRLFLAHLIADFPLQTNKIFEFKRSTPYGILAHTGIYLLISVILSIPYLRYLDAVIFLIFLFSIHTLIDVSKVRNFLSKDGLKEFLLDQFKHFLSLMLVFLLPSGNRVLYLSLPESLRFIERFYNSDYYILLGIGYFFVSFAGTIFYFYIVKTFGIKNFFGKEGISTKSKYLEVLFRSVIFFVYYKFSFFYSLIVFLMLRILEILANKNYKGVGSIFLIVLYDFVFIFSMIYFLNNLLGT